MVEHDGKLCRDCQTAGKVVLAHRIIGTTGVCDFHYRSRLGMPLPTTSVDRVIPRPQPAPAVPEKKEETKVAASLGIDWEKAQQERNEGATTTALAEKYHCSVPTICAHTKAATNGKRPMGRLERISEGLVAERPKKARSIVEAPRRKTAAKETSGGVASAIAELISKRDKLNLAIETLQGIDL